MALQLDLQQVSITLGGTPIVHSANLSLQQGEIGCLLGPSGCGKTTLLRSIAGFVSPSAGQIFLGDRLIASADSDVPTEQRKVGMVFQDLALFPHLSVGDNVAFGISQQSRKARLERVKQLLALVSLEDFHARYPHELSGGQQQRVALVRAMAPKPKLLLLDEPFSSQDTERREHLAREVRRVLQEESTTALLVTHDQNEAFAMADRIGVIEAGHMQQWDSAHNLYHHPATAFVASFIGDGALIQGTATTPQKASTELGEITCAASLTPGQSLQILLRPDQLHIDPEGHSVEVVGKAFRGAQQLYTLALPSGATLQCLSAGVSQHQVGDSVGLNLSTPPSACFPTQEK